MTGMDLMFRLAELVFLAGGAYGAGRMLVARVEALERRISEDLGQLRADVRAVHERINSEVAARVVVPLKREA